MSKQPPDKIVKFSSFKANGAEEAIAREVEAHLSALNSLCAYVGWSNVAQHLNLAEAELTAIIKRKHLNCAHQNSAETISQESPRRQKSSC